MINTRQGFFKSIEYKDEVYFVAIDRYDRKVKVAKLCSQTGQEEIIFEKIADETYDVLISESPILFIKDDVLYLYSVTIETISLSLSLNLQDGKLQQQNNVLSISGRFYMHCFQNPYIYLMNDNFIGKIDCSNFTYMEIDCSNFEMVKMNKSLMSQNEAIILENKIYFFVNEKYEVDMETEAIKVVRITHGLLPSRFERFYITGNNKIRAYGTKEHKAVFMEITFDDVDSLTV